MIATYMIIALFYIKVLVLSWIRLPLQWLNLGNRDERREQRRCITGKHVLIAVKGESIQIHHEELIKEIVIKFVDLNVKSIILASADAKSCIKIWEDLNATFGIEDQSQDVFDPRMDLNFLTGRRNRSKLKLFFQPIDLFGAQGLKFTENVRKHNKRVWLSYIVSIGDDGKNEDCQFLKSLEGIMAKQVILVRIVNDLTLFVNQVNSDIILKGGNNRMRLESAADHIQTTELFLGHPMKLNLSVIPRLPVDLSQIGQFKIFLENWIEFIVRLMTQIDTSTAADIVVASCLENPKSFNTVHSFYGHPLQENQ